jgi:rhodanese-related sulfurtransferase
MKYLNRYFAVLVAVLLLTGLFGCSDDETTSPEPEPVNEFNVMIEYLEGAGGDFINTTSPKIVSSSAIAPDIASYKIIDIRQQADYDSAHIAGAVNVSLGDVVTYCEANFQPTDKILVCCYTGQSAGHAVLALNLLGWDAYSLGFGMSSVDPSTSSLQPDLDRWSSRCTNDYVGSFTTTATAKDAAGDYPTLNTGKTDAGDILRDRVDAMLAGGFKGIGASTVLANPSNYYIVNYFSETDYSGQGDCPPGHINGAIQYTPKVSLKTSEDLNTLPTDKPIVVYCWTGQNSSQVTAWLNVLGYEAYSLTFGVNGMVYDEITAHKWSQGAISALPLQP